jgi:hypothetical protein
VVEAFVSSRRCNTPLLAGLGVLSLDLAGIVTYGLVSYGVTQRGFELVLRMALGAAMCGQFMNCLAAMTYPVE